MLKLNYISLTLLFALLLLGSCTKENLDEVTVEKDDVVPTVTSEANSLLTRSNDDESTEGLDFGCIAIEYPFSVLDNEGVEHAINSEVDFFAVLDSTNGTYIVDFVYPLEVSQDDGSTMPIDNAEDLGELFAECIPNGGWDESSFPAYLIGSDNSCFTISYPIKLVDLNGNEVEIDNEVDFVAAIAEKEYLFVFPFNLQDEEGEIEAIENVDDLFEALISCNDYNFDGDTTGFDWSAGFEFLGCYQLIFPFNVLIQDGTTVVVENHQQYCDLLLQGGLVDYTFPLRLTNEDGVEIEVSDKQELNELLEMCYPVQFGIEFYALIDGAIGIDSVGVEPIDPCYIIDFPIEVQYADPTSGELHTASIVDLDEAQNFMYKVIELIYPINITYIDGGSELALNSKEEVFEAFEDCIE